MKNRGVLMNFWRNLEMKKLIKNLKMKYKSNLLVKLAAVRKENKYLKEKLSEEMIEKRKIIDEITIKNQKIRELSLKVEQNEKVLCNQ